MAVISTDGKSTTSESQCDDPVLRRPIISPLSIGPRYMAVVSTRAGAGSSHMPPFLATASLWIVCTIASRESRRAALLLDSSLYRLIASTTRARSARATEAQAREGGPTNAALAGG